MAVLQPFLAIFCQLYTNLLQKWGSDSHFEELNKSKSQLVQKLWYKTQKRQMVFLLQNRKTPESTMMWKMNIKSAKFFLSFQVWLGFPGGYFGWGSTSEGAKVIFFQFLGVVQGRCPNMIDFRFQAKLLMKSPPASNIKKWNNMIRTLTLVNTWFIFLSVGGRTHSHLINLLKKMFMFLFRAKAISQ